MFKTGIVYAAVAGVCAALAGLSAKYTLSTENLLELIKIGGKHMPSTFLVRDTSPDYISSNLISYF